MIFVLFLQGKMNRLMFTPIDLNKTITLNGYTFKVYSIDNFNFNSCLEISTQNGLYCFTQRYKTELINKLQKKEFCFTHKLLYLGKADGKEGLKGRLTSTHEKFEKLKEFDTVYLCLHITSDDKDVKQIESEILHSYSFSLNQLENQTSNLAFTVKED